MVADVLLGRLNEQRQLLRHLLAVVLQLLHLLLTHRDADEEGEKDGAGWGGEAPSSRALQGLTSSGVWAMRHRVERSVQCESFGEQQGRWLSRGGEEGEEGLRVKDSDRDTAPASALDRMSAHSGEAQSPQLRSCSSQRCSLLVASLRTPGHHSSSNWSHSWCWPSSWPASPLRSSSPAVARVTATPIASAASPGQPQSFPTLHSRARQCLQRSASSPACLVCSLRVLCTSAVASVRTSPSCGPHALPLLCVLRTAVGGGSRRA